MNTYILSHPLWGWLCIPDYPCMWTHDKAQAHHFVDRTNALLVRHHWNEAVEITIEEIGHEPSCLHPRPSA